MQEERCVVTGDWSLRVKVDCLSLDLWENSHIFLANGRAYFTVMIDGEIHITTVRNEPEHEVFGDTIEFALWVNDNDARWLGQANPTDVIDAVLEQL